MKIRKNCTNKEYADLAVYCNQNDCHIEQKGNFFESVQNENKELSYSEKRALEYPSIQDQLDILYWDKVNGTENWKDLIASIKHKYPKE